MDRKQTLTPNPHLLPMNYDLGIIGGGNMAEAIVRAAIDHQIIEPDRIVIADPAADRRGVFEPIGVTVTDRNGTAITEAGQVMLAVKPQVLAELAEELRAVDPQRQVVLSIMAGVSTHRIAGAVGEAARVVRVMPNTPLLAGCGMSAIALGEHARDGDQWLAMRIFQAAGEAVVVTEEQMDAVTAVSGSGPAYLFYLAEAMTDAARSLGLRDDLADLLTRQTLLGAATLLRQSPNTPQQLRRKVTSPGGTTEAAIQHLDAHHARKHITDAVQQAAEQSRKLGQ